MPVHGRGAFTGHPRPLMILAGCFVHTHSAPFFLLCWIVPVLLGAVGLTPEATAQVPAPPGFTTMQFGGLAPHAFRGGVVVGDFDRRRFNDGVQDRMDRMDVLLTGLRMPRSLDPAQNFPFSQLYLHVTQVIRGEGGPTFAFDFTPNGSLLQNVFYSDAAAYDYDDDGDLDLLLLGATSGGAPFQPVTTLYRNNGAAPLRLEAAASFIGLYYGSAAWGDYDNDGDGDLLLTGMTDDGPTTVIYRSDGNDVFTPVDPALVDVGFGDAAWGDYDGDDDLDVLIAGAVGPGQFVSKIYRNDGNDAFTDIDAPLPGLSFSRVAWLDADADGRLDAFVTGGFLNPFIMESRAVLLRHLGDDRFAEIPFEGSGAFDGDLAVGDYDGDGDTDLVLSGRSRASETDRTRLFRNDGDAFRLDYSVDQTLHAALALADYNRDGTLDLFITGFNPNAAGLAKPQTQFYQSDRFNAPPQPPTGLQASVNDQTVTLSWTPADDDRTPGPGLTYNIRVGMLPGASDVVSAMAEPDGTRWVSAPGNAGAGGSKRLTLPRGSYYWSVQALDAGYAGSAFAPEQLFTTGDPNDRTPPDAPADVRAFAGDRHVVVVWSRGPEPDIAQHRIYRATSSPADVLFASTDARTLTFVDEDVDLGTSYLYRVTAVDESGNESAYSAEAEAVPAFQINLLPDRLPREGRRAAWGDYDADGDLDLALINSDLSNQIWRNDDTFFLGVRFSGQTFSGLFNAATAWVDVDHDGDLDFTLAARSGALDGIAVYAIDDQEVFQRLPGLDGLGVNQGALAWGDYDNDGDFDLAASGTSAFRDTTLVYRNDDGLFSDILAGLPPSAEGSLAWGDYDGDLDLDLLLAGNGLATIYRNDDGRFIDANAGLEGILLGEAVWGDYDNDGDLDLALVGRGVRTQGPTARIYRNDIGAGGGFADIAADLRGGTNGAAAWGDYDNDGDLDLALAGEDDDGRHTTLYLNDRGTFLDSGLTFTGLDRADLAWGDFDGDGDLDLLALGRAVQPTPLTLLYRNEIDPPNAPPAAPTGLAATVDEATGEVRLRWNPSSDDTTPAPGLTYALRVGTTPGGIEVLAPMALADGTPQQPVFGNTFHNTAWRLRNLPPGTYFWSVQARDPSFRGSPFADEASFTVGSGKDGTATALDDEDLPDRPILDAGYPNPFRDRATVRYVLPAPAEVHLAVYDVLGRRVRMLAAGTRPAGRHTAVWDGTGDDGAGAASGLYLVRLEIRDGPRLTRTLTRIR